MREETNKIDVCYKQRNQYHFHFKHKFLSGKLVLSLSFQKVWKSEQVT